MSTAAPLWWFLRRRQRPPVSDADAQAQIRDSLLRLVEDFVEEGKTREAARVLQAMGPVPGSFGDRNSYGPGPCAHLAPYPGCPKCWHGPVGVSDVG